MNIQRILLAVVVLALTVGCTWAATEASGTAGFAVIPDKEGIQILGGDGWVCTKAWDQDYYKCGDTEEDCSIWVWLFETWQCGPAPSGECDDSALVIGLRWGGCVWDPVTGTCDRDGTAEDVPVNGCTP